MTELVEVVIPSVGRPSLGVVLAPLLGRLPVTVVDDRPADAPDLRLPDGVRVLRTGGRGPAAARNAGWRAGRSTWVAFLDDDVEPPQDWVDHLLADLRAAPEQVAGSQGRLHVPLPADRRPTDWERSTAGLETARWATADLAYRRAALESVAGFDERFPRAYREDADLGLRVVRAGWAISAGRRHVRHPVRPAPWQQSIRSQRGNADDVLMRALHGPGWRTAAGVPRGRRPWHLVTSLCLVLGVLTRGQQRRAAALAWALLTADFARRRIVPGPRTPREVTTMAVTSLFVPLAATAHWLRGWAQLRRLLAGGRRAT